MFRLTLLVLVVFLSSCNTNSYLTEKVWIRDHIDSGDFDANRIKTDKAIFVGSRKDKYSNIESEIVKQLDNNLLSLLRKKYGDDNILTNNDISVNRGYFEISYVILNNEVTTHNKSRSSEDCFVTDRAVDIQVNVVDIKNKKTVWSGKIDRHKSKNKCRERSKPDNDSLFGLIVESFVDSVAEGVTDSMFGTYPDAPSIENVANMVFHGFSRSMP